MTQKELNERIAMSLLAQCAWMWEYCTRNPNEGRFRLTDVVQGLTSRNRTNTKPGYTMTDMDWCEYWQHFVDRIDGLKYFDRMTGEVTLEFDTFRCSYLLTNVYSIAKAFCQGNGCGSLINKTVFGYEDGERYCHLPEAKATQKAQKVSPKSAPRNSEELRVKNDASPSETISAISAGQKNLADRLREALRARLAA